jgi:hypothetical protein
MYETGEGSSPYAVAAGDFNNDTYLDIAVANYGSKNIGIFLGFGNGGFANQTIYSAGTYPYSLAVGDFDNDLILDIIVANYGSNNIGIFRGYSNGTFANILFIQLEYGSGPFSVLVGDFNSDKKLDFVVANDGSDNLQLFLQTC